MRASKHARLLLPAGALALFVACSALPEAAAYAGSLLSTAAQNYAPKYSGKVEKLVNMLLDQVGFRRDDDELGSIGLDVAVLFEGASGGGVSPVADGETVKTGDRFKLSFRADRACHVYVISIDGTGWVSQVFPRPHFAQSNPVGSGREQRIPEGAAWYVLDQNTGVETLYFLATHEPQAELEALLGEFDRLERPATVPTRSVEEPVVVNRGFQEVGPGAATAVETEAGETVRFEPTTFQSIVGEGGMVITRWFRHE